MATFDRYNDAHEHENGPGDARPTAQQIVDDEGLRGALSDKTVLITGCSSGLGVETARAMLTTGATVFMTARNMDKGEGVRRALLQDDPSVGPQRLQLVQMDNSSLESVREAAKNFLSKSDKLNILINNAGVAMTPHGTTKDGFETQFGVNHLAHFLLFQLLAPILERSSTAEFQSRVINLSSLAHRLAPVQLDDYNLEKTGYNPYVAYGSSKTCNIWMSNEVERRYGARGIHSLSVHPGGIRTGLLDSHDPTVREQMEAAIADPGVMTIMKNVEQGAATTVLAAVGRAFEGVGGLYMEDCKVGEPNDPAGPQHAPGYATWAYDNGGAEQLWKDSEKFVGASS